MRRAALTPLLVACAIMVLSSGAAQAGPFYLLARLGSTDTGIDLAGGFNNVLDGDDNSSSFGLGFKLGRNLSFQAEYHDLGNVAGISQACPIDSPACLAPVTLVEADSSAVSVSMLPSLLLTRRIRIYVKLGYISWDTDVSAVRDAGSDFLEELSDEDLVWGAGLRLELPGPIDGYAEYERIADLFDTVAIGATWGF